MSGASRTWPTKMEEVSASTTSAKTMVCHSNSGSFLTKFLPYFARAVPFDNSLGEVLKAKKTATEAQT